MSDAPPTDEATPRPDGSGISPRETRRLATGLIAYGSVGIVLSIVSIVAVFWLNGHFDSVAEEVDVQVGQLEQTLGSTRRSLDQVAASADAFGATFETTAAGLAQAEAVVGNLSGFLDDLRNLAVFGIPVLRGSSSVLDSLSDELGELQPSLVTIGESLTVNATQLDRTSAALRELSSDLGGIQRTLEDGLVERGVGAGFRFLRVMIIALTVWLAVPAVAAFLIGIFLRRATAPASD